MGRFGLLLILAGLAVGLWLGFNPATHKQLVHMWDEARATNVAPSAQRLLSFRHLDRQVNRWLAARDEVPRVPQPEDPKLVTGQQVTNAFQAFIQALQQLVLGFLAKLGLSGPRVGAA